MRPLQAAFAPYEWAPSTDELARRAGLDPVNIIRFDANVPPQPPPSARPATVASALCDVNTYPHGGYVELVEAVARYADVSPENVVMGSGADDLILLCARALVIPGERVAVPEEPTYPLYRIAAALARADASCDSPALTFCCRPNNPTGAFGDLPKARPLVVDEAYFEYAAATAVELIDEGVVVIRTFSKAFGLAGARVGYLLAEKEVAEELRQRQAPAQVSTLSARLALAALEAPPDVEPVIEERHRVEERLVGIGLRPLPSHTNFLFVPVEDADTLADALLRAGVVVRRYPGAIRFNVRDRYDDDVLLEALEGALDRRSPITRSDGRRGRHVRVTAETTMRVRLSLDGTGQVRVATGTGFYDHLLEQLAFHAGLDLVLEGVGDLETGSHHTLEDAALALGEALDSALGERRGIARFGHAVVPMDDALGSAAIDLGGRPWAEVKIAGKGTLGAHMLKSLAQAARFGLHLTASGDDPHHVLEAAFKAVGRSLRASLRAEGALVPSTKGSL